jgi:hypothetical protein
MGGGAAGPRGRAWLLAIALLVPAAAGGERIAVVHREGVVHGFLALRTLEGELLADGDLIQTTVPGPRGNRVTARVVLRFKDGSVHEETTVYVQRKTFRFVSNRVVQRGPAFKTPLESRIAANGEVDVRYTDEDGKEQRVRERLELPPDVANGMILALLKNVPPDQPKTTVSLVAITPKPRLVKLELVRAGDAPFSTAGTHRKAAHFVLKVDVPGLVGAVASLVGKTPPDSHAWVLAGEAPALLRAEMPLFAEGPLWRLEMLVPSWPSDREPKE